MKFARNLPIVVRGTLMNKVLIERGATWRR